MLVNNIVFNEVYLDEENIPRLSSKLIIFKEKKYVSHRIDAEGQKFGPITVSSDEFSPLSHEKIERDYRIGYHELTGDEIRIYEPWQVPACTLYVMQLPKEYVATKSDLKHNLGDDEWTKLRPSVSADGNVFYFSMLQEYSKPEIKFEVEFIIKKNIRDYERILVSPEIIGNNNLLSTIIKHIPRAIVAIGPLAKIASMIKF